MQHTYVGGKGGKGAPGENITCPTFFLMKLITGIFTMEKSMCVDNYFAHTCLSIAS